MNPYRLQLLACSIGIVAGFAPCFSLTGSFWEMGLSQFGEGPVHVDRVAPGSPAEAAGFRAGDRIDHPGGFDGVQRDLKSLRPGDRRSFAVRRNGGDSTVEVTGTSPQLAAVWYADLWHPIAGALFLAVGLLVFGTAPLTPPPYWRSVVVAVAGLGLAAGFALALAWGTAFSRFTIWQRWLMGDGAEWRFGQGFAGLTAGVLLAGFAAAEVRARLTKALQQTGPA